MQLLDRLAKNCLNPAQPYWSIWGHRLNTCYKMDVFVILNTATKCLFICWDIGIKQWWQDHCWQLRWMLVWEGLSCLSAPDNSHVAIASLYLIKQSKNLCLMGLHCINCLNPFMYHPDRFLHWTTRSSCQVSSSSLLPQRRNKNMNGLITSYDSAPAKLTFL